MAEGRSHHSVTVYCPHTVSRPQAGAALPDGHPSLRLSLPISQKQKGLGQFFPILGTLFVYSPKALRFKRLSFPKLVLYKIIQNSLQYFGRGSWGRVLPASLGSKETMSRQSTHTVSGTLKVLSPAGLSYIS